jgi:hypothetical protein
MEHLKSNENDQSIADAMTRLHNLASEHPDPEKDKIVQKLLEQFKTAQEEGNSDEVIRLIGEIEKLYEPKPKESEKTAEGRSSQRTFNVPAGDQEYVITHTNGKTETVHSSLSFEEINRELLKYVKENSLHGSTKITARIPLNRFAADISETAEPKEHVITYEDGTTETVFSPLSIVEMMAKLVENSRSHGQKKAVKINTKETNKHF